MSKVGSESEAGPVEEDATGSEGDTGSETDDAGCRLATFASSIFLRSSTMLSCVDLDGTASSDVSSLHSTNAVIACL